MCCIWVGLAKSMTKNKPEGLAAGADRTMRWVLKGWQDWQLGVGGILVTTPYLSGNLLLLFSDLDLIPFVWPVPVVSGIQK